ncbi:MAG: hypothetical protein JRG94_21755 [Deltaproteobacteria bacterium]|nr:hypothetical protein [Deltaproteobacteria bacterium]
MNSEVVIAMLVDRPYVLVFLAAFLVVSGAERGWKRTLFWLVSGTFLGLARRVQQHPERFSLR